MPTSAWTRSGSSPCGSWTPRERWATQALRDFLARGYTTQNALEVVLGIGTYTMSTLANRLTGAAVDDQLAAHAWHPVAP